MRPTIAEPAEPAMRFFTPELYLQFNSSDDREADAANEVWESAIVNYERHLDALRERVPSYASGILDLCLHDAVMTGFQEIPLVHPDDRQLKELSVRPLTIALFLLRQGEKTRSLAYRLGGEIRLSSVAAGWVSTSPQQWLYDELDEDPASEGVFLHRILFSDGRVLEIPFRSILVSEPSASSVLMVRKPALTA
jgi:hypothetical protein